MTKTRLMPKTHCKHGHAFTVENTWRSTGVRQGMRQCRACRRRTCRRQKPAWRQQRSASGRCRTCPSRLEDPQFVSCVACREVDRMRAARRYWDRCERLRLEGR